MLPSLILVLLAFGAPPDATTVRVEGSPDTEFTIECAGEALTEGSEDGVFRPPQLFELPAGSASCELAVLTGGRLTVEVRGTQGSISRIATSGANSRITFSID